MYRLLPYFLLGLLMTIMTPKDVDIWKPLVLSSLAACCGIWIEQNGRQEGREKALEELRNRP